MAIPVTNIVMNVTQASVGVKTELVPSTVVPSNATEKNIVWSILDLNGVPDAGAATIHPPETTGGVTKYFITPLKPGMLRIRATIINGKLS